MFQLFYQPSPILASLVNNIMINHVKTEPGQPKKTFPFPPLPEHSIMFYPYDRPEFENAITKRKLNLPRCIVVGPQTDRMNLTFGDNHLIIKVGLQPGGLFRMLGLRMEEFLTYGEFDGQDIFGCCVNDIITALAEADCPQSMQIIVETFVLQQSKKIKCKTAFDYALPEILKHDGAIKIGALASTACMSTRQFERVFKERMGLSPKFYSRLVRFGKAWIMKEINPNLTWTDIAHSNGYYDQMHLIHDFQVFAGTNPQIISKALEQQPFSLNHRIFY